MIGSTFSNIWSFAGGGTTDGNFFTWQYLINYNIRRRTEYAESQSAHLEGAGGKPETAVVLSVTISCFV